MTISGKKPKKNVDHGVNEKSGVDPPPSPTTPTSYRQLFCNLRQVHPYGETTSLLRTHAYCKTHAYYDMSYHNVELVSNYKTTVGGLTPNFSVIPWLTFFVTFFVIDSLLPDMVISHDI